MYLSYVARPLFQWSQPDFSNISFTKYTYYDAYWADTASRRMYHLESNQDFQNLFPLLYNQILSIQLQQSEFNGQSENLIINLNRDGFIVSYDCSEDYIDSPSMTPSSFLMICI